MEKIFYNKKYKLNFNNTYFILSLKSILKDNFEILQIKLTRILIDSITHFYYEKNLQEIYKEYFYLNDISSINLLINYFCSIIEKNKIKLYNVDNNTYNIIFKDIEKNRNIIFILKSKNYNNEKIPEKKGNSQLNKMEENNNVGMNEINPKNNNEKNDNNKNENIINNNNENNNKNNSINNSLVDNKNGNNNYSINKTLVENEKSQIGDNEKNDITKISDSVEQFSSKDKESEYQFDKSVSLYKSYSMIDISNNPSIENISNNNINNNSEIRNEENNIKKSYIHKENNKEILFKKKPDLINDKRYITDSNLNEECEFFTAFNFSIGGQQPIIVWTTKNDNKTIYLMNWATKKPYQEKNAHNAKINSFQYYYKDNGGNNKENNDYIISLSYNDKETLKIWNIDLNSNLNLITTIMKRISCFCMFSNKYYDANNTVLIAYIKKNAQKNIFFWKLDNDFKFLENDESSKNMQAFNDVNYLDIFYYRKNNEIYLINCNNHDVNVILDPFTYNDIKNKIFDKSISHLNAFIIEKDNHLKLFDANLEGIFIWDYNNYILEKEIKCGVCFDMCIWDEKFLWASTFEGFKLIQIEEGEIIKTIDEDNSKRRNGSKIRKISSLIEYESIIGIDSNRKLCLWT